MYILWVHGQGNPRQPRTPCCDSGKPTPHPVLWPLTERNSRNNFGFYHRKDSCSCSWELLLSSVVLGLGWPHSEQTFSTHICPPPVSNILHSSLSSTSDLWSLQRINARPLNVMIWCGYCKNTYQLVSTSIGEYKLNKRHSYRSGTRSPCAPREKHLAPIEPFNMLSNGVTHNHA